MATAQNTPTGGTFMERFAREVKKEIAGQGTTITAVAEQMGLNFEKLSRRLRGFVPFPIDEVAQLAVVLHVPLSKLIERAEKG